VGKSSPRQLCRILELDLNTEFENNEYANHIAAHDTLFGEMKAEPAGRYICHCEDEPMIFSECFDDIGDAMQTAHDQVASALERNGCGDGLVLDTRTDRIVAIFGSAQSAATGDENHFTVGTVPLPQEGEQVRMRHLVKSWRNHFCGDGEQPPFIWNTVA